jgi:alpha-galactosidase
MSGRLGFDIDIQKLSEEEREFCRQAVQNYKRLAHVIQQGDLYRLVSPYDEPRAVLMYVNESKDHAVLFSYTTHARVRERFALVRLQGLDPNKTYDVREINTFAQASQVYSYGTAEPIEFLSMTGEQLMTEGIPVSSRHAIQSRVFEITVSE